MKPKYVLSIAAAVAGGAALLAEAAYAHGGFGPGGRHHGSAAARACIAVMTPDQRADLKSIFADVKGNLMTDHQNVQSAREALTLGILEKKDNLGSLQNSLSAAKLKLLQDEDAAAVRVCGLLNAKQLSAAEGLYKNLAALHKSTREQAREYFKQARSAAGDAAAAEIPGDAQGGPQSVE
jgi:Skp family chaperone for outer membrane proteins